ncbi:MAG: hypothetical protein A3H91_05900 [Gammaproteobacteria bacterium RIFCSPLOWO2_02_FULL_61_13]|nr:MAG: hypothetical protein A3H91_05900 [Gammaproteobacteria bacterium RIFCSPLOWO2_02_FULL_61_13]
MTHAELEFLPAALEIQETPPLPAARWILWSIMLFFTIAIVWASIGRVDIVGVAQGKIVPTARVKVIQPLETGVVQEIFVQEGDRVSAGQPLIMLDSTLARADRDQLQEQELALSLERARLLTLLAAMGERDRQVPASLFTDPPDSLVRATAIQIRLQEDRVRTQLAEYRAQVGALEDDQRQRESERDAVSNRIQQLDATIPLVTERAQSLQGLAEKGLVPRTQWLELEQQRIVQVKQRDVEQNNLAMLGASISSIGQRGAALQAEFARGLLMELTEVENKITGIQQEYIKAEQRVALQALSAPVSGTVHRLGVHTIGGVVTPAQELMHIVPDEEAMEIEAWVQNRDIGFVRAGQEAEIKVETFPFTRYGTLDGEVRSVSRDATPDERLGLVYAARVRMHKAVMQVEDKIVSLTPGMAVTVEVNLGTRRLIEYLLSPLLRYRDESAKER